MDCFYFFLFMLEVAISNGLLTGYMLQLIQFLLNVQNRQTALFSATQTKKVCASYLYLIVVDQSISHMLP